MNYDRLPQEKKTALIDILQRRHGWPAKRCEEELRGLDEIALAYISVEDRLARKSETGYSPFASMFKVRN